eukprot:1588524-Amphidinium_carterae.2
MKRHLSCCALMMWVRWQGTMKMRSRHQLPLGLREHMLHKYEKIAEELQEQEGELKRGMPEWRCTLLTEKKILLLKRMMEDAGCRDEDLWKDLSSGFELVGSIGKSHEWPEMHKKAVLPMDSMAKPIRSRVQAMIMASGDDELDEKVWSETMKEVSANWIAGPLTEQQLNESAGMAWIPNHRFGIEQSGKVRVIDDFSSSTANCTAEVHEKRQLRDMDVFLNVARAWYQATQAAGGAWAEAGVELRGRCFRCVISVWSPSEKRPALFIMRALPFGAVGSVYGFCRVAAATAK